MTRSLLKRVEKLEAAHRVCSNCNFAEYAIDDAGERMGHRGYCHVDGRFADWTLWEGGCSKFRPGKPGERDDS